MKPLFIKLCIIVLIGNPLFAQKPEKQMVYFEVGQSEPNESSKESLKTLTDKLKTKSIKNIRIISHTDEDGSDKFNSVLSKKRAERTSAYFSAIGIQQQKIITENYGEQKPLSANSGDAGKQQNRCVEIEIMYDFSIPKSFTVAYKTFMVDPTRDTNLKINAKGTVLHIPKNCFIDSKGKSVTQAVTLKYREYKNPAEIAFSDITMNYKANGEEFCFNSSGMFELQGSVNNGSVRISTKKPIKIDYALAKKNPDISFFKLNEDKRNWKKITHINRDGTLGPKKEIIEVNDLVFDKYEEHAKKGVKGNAKLVDNGNRKNGTLLTGSGDAGHSYPDIIAGLNVDSFGVYNCDQIYRLANRVDINAKYVDADGNEINDLHVLSLIDLKYNGAFSFDPNKFTCDAKAQNVLALFTKKGDLYILDKSEFMKLNITGNGDYTFKMKNVTNTIKSSKDLAAYLGIKI